MITTFKVIFLHFWSSLKPKKKLEDFVFCLHRIKITKLNVKYIESFVFAVFIYIYSFRLMNQMCVNPVKQAKANFIIDNIFHFKKLSEQYSLCNDPIIAICSGQYNAILKMVHRTTGKQVAVKFHHCDSTNTNLIREIFFLDKLQKNNNLIEMIENGSAFVPALLSNNLSNENNQINGPEKEKGNRSNYQHRDAFNNKNNELDHSDTNIFNNAEMEQKQKVHFQSAKSQQFKKVDNFTKQVQPKILVHYCIVPFYKTDLFDFMFEPLNPKKPQIQNKKLFTKLFDMMDSLHVQNHVHLDIKPENIMIDFESADNFQLVLIDFATTLSMPHDGKFDRLMIGTLYYQSLNRMMKGSVSFADDFESLLYTYWFVTTNNLNYYWNAKSFDGIANQKKNISMCSKLPQYLKTLIEYSRSLQPNDKIDKTTIYKIAGIS